MPLVKPGLVSPIVPPNSLNWVLSHMIALKDVLEAVVTERGPLTPQATRHLASASTAPSRPTHAEAASVIYILTDSESED